MVQQEGQVMRKGAWTEHEDVQLVSYVNLYGDRRWDFIAKVSGLKRTGKSCRLRWLNYLHPDLKRDKMSPHEEHLVLQLHSKWGNRWSRIARKLPGRTDNEIKNYWRTYMRKKSQEKKSTIERNFFDTAGATAKIQLQEKKEDTEKGDYSMNEIWNDIVLSEDEAIKPFCPTTITSLIWEWDCCPDSLWDITDQEKDADMFFLPSEPFHSLFGPEDSFFTG